MGESGGCHLGPAGPDLVFGFLPRGDSDGPKCFADKARKQGAVCKLCSGPPNTPL